MKILKITLCLATFVCAQGKAVIFNQDNRIEAQTQTTPFWSEKAKSVVALIPHEFIQQNSQGDYNLKGLELHKGPLNFCPKARFASQKLIANCTGSLISDRHVLTAAHCIDKDSSRKRGCQDYKIAFNYATDNEGMQPDVLDSGDVFQCQKILYHRFDIENFTEDLAIIELDRKVTERQPLKLQLEAPELGTPLAMIGHPLGVPQKFSDDAEVLDSLPEKLSFRHNLETFSVNSGGPIFDALTGEQVGVLVRGTGTNTTQSPGEECYDWTTAQADDFAEGNDLTPLKNISNLLK